MRFRRCKSPRYSTRARKYQHTMVRIFAIPGVGVLHLVCVTVSGVLAGIVHQLPIPTLIQVLVYLVLGGTSLLVLIYPSIFRFVWIKVRSVYGKNRHLAVINHHWDKPAPARTIKLAFRLSGEEGFLSEFQQRMSRCNEKASPEKVMTVGELWTQLELARLDAGLTNELPQRLFIRHNSMDA